MYAEYAEPDNTEIVTALKGLVGSAEANIPASKIEAVNTVVAGIMESGVELCSSCRGQWRGENYPCQYCSYGIGENEVLDLVRKVLLWYGLNRSAYDGLLSSVVGEKVSYFA